MTISGEAAAGYNAVRRDDSLNANKGPLISADDETGEVTYKDTPGQHEAIRIMKK